MVLARRNKKARIAVLVAVLGLMLWAFVIEPRRLVVRHVELTVPRWPAARAGLRVALLSDIHAGSPHWGIERIRDLVARTNAEHADLVVLAGDYMINSVVLGTKIEPEPIAEALGQLRAPYGVFAVLGNHDWWNDGERMRRALEARGIQVLENEARAVVNGDGAIFIAGLADAVTRTPDAKGTFAKVPPDAAIIAVIHEPDFFVTLGNRPSITLAGHSHGGQVRLPLIGRPIVPSVYGERFAAGHIVENGRHLFVTTGVGTSILPIRFGVPPEIVVLTLG